MAATALSQEKVWFDKPSYDKAECFHFEKLAKVVSDNIKDLLSINKLTTEKKNLTSTEQQTKSSSKKSKEKKNKADKKNVHTKNDDEKKDDYSNQESQGDACSMDPAVQSLADEFAKAREHIKKSLQCIDNIEAEADRPIKDVPERLEAIEYENRMIKSAVRVLETQLGRLQDDDDDDVDLFGSDSEGEDDEAAKIREQRLAAYAAKKSKKPVLIAKSNIILDIKPWDDETDMKAMEQEVRKIQCDGLLWGAAKLVPLAYGIKKLQISCVVEDDKVSIDWLTETIQEQEDYVQSVDIAAFNKV
ncbi:probable elongation factor 1-delta [Aphidius gifuensis]|uniref:probable elongation factor 1-delta n=1 Tax=Aphidius gifuensis TaxID=684658 RepID=UPI001CDC505A|nr:probable elongation factor 1-delta [Aphidius gifuensis]